MVASRGAQRDLAAPAADTTRHQGLAMLDRCDHSRLPPQAVVRRGWLLPRYADDEALASLAL